MKTNGWQRLGIIASVAWAIGGYFLILNKLTDHDLEVESTNYQYCAEIRDQTAQSNREACARESDKAPMRDATTHFAECMEPFDQQQRDMDQRCSDDGEKYVIEGLRTDRKVAAFFALVPIPVAWGVVYLLLFLGRWVKRGFAN